MGSPNGKIFIRKARQLLAVLPLVFTAACDTAFGGYMGDRLMDLADVPSAGFAYGLGFDLDAQATRFFGLGVGQYRGVDAYGFIGRQIGYWTEDRTDFNLGLAILGRVDRRKCGGDVIEVINPPDQMFAWFDQGKPLFRFEARLHLAVIGINFGLDPAELLDFVLGIFMIDPFGDSYYLSNEYRKKELLRHYDDCKARAQGNDDRTFDLVMAIAEDPDPLIRRYSLELLGIFRRKEAVPILRRGLERDSVVEIELAANALLLSSSPQADEVLIQSAGKGSLKKRKAILRTMARSSRSSYRPLFLESAEWPGLEYEATIGIASVGTPDDLPLLHKIEDRLLSKIVSEDEKKDLKDRFMLAEEAIRIHSEKRDEYLKEWNRRMKILENSMKEKEQE